MQVKDQETFTLIDAIGSHYRANLNNRYVRQALVHMSLDTASWSLIESITEKSDYYRLQGYHFDELYERVLALARFIYHARREVQPHLRSLLSRGAPSGHSPAAGNDRVLREMAVNNFGSNLNILADLVDKLYQHVTSMDATQHKNETPVYKRNRELTELGRYLVPK